MNTLKLKIATPDYVIYFYYPDGKGEPGEVRMDINVGNAFVLTQASNDNSAGHYGFKAANAVKECVADNNIPLEFTNAWH